MDFVNLPILIFAALLCISILTSLFSLRAGIPLILIFLCIGLLAGTGSFEMLETLRRPKICFFVGSLALALILFDSGFQTEIKNYRMAKKPSIILATIGVIATAAFLTPFGKYFLNLGWIPSFLLTAIISSTDSAAVFFLLRSQGISLREKVKATLEVESGANDPMAIFLTLSAIILIQHQATHNWSSYASLIFLFLSQILVGGGMGYLLGKAITFCVNQLNLETALYPIFVIGLALLGFSVTNILGGSGFLAVYIAGLLSGNSKIQARTQISKFQQTLTWLSQITMFTCLGLFVTLSGLQQYWKPALILGLLLTFVARPVMVWTILSFFKNYSASDKNFISFVGLRGATSILLALMPIVYQLDFADAFFNIIFVMVLLSLSLQGFLIPTVARLCHVIIPVNHADPTITGVDLPGLVDSSLLLYELAPEAPAVQGKTIPRWAKPILVVRDGIAYFSGNGLKHLHGGDKVYVFLPSNSRRRILDELYTGNPALQGNNDLFGDFPLDPATTFQTLSALYGLKIPKNIQNTTISEFIQNELTDIEVGDRLSLGAVDLVIRAMDNGVLTEIGLDVDPTRERSFYTKTHGLNIVSKSKI